jgi:hypothetical protein
MHMFIALILVLALAVAALALWGLMPLVHHAADESAYASPVAPAADSPQQRIAEEAGSSSMSGSQS